MVPLSQRHKILWHTLIWWADFPCKGIKWVCKTKHSYSTWTFSRQSTLQFNLRQMHPFLPRDQSQIAKLNLKTSMSNNNTSQFILKTILQITTVLWLHRERATVIQENKCTLTLWISKQDKFHQIVRYSSLIKLSLSLDETKYQVSII